MPSARSNASWPSRITGESGATRPGGAADQRSTSRSAPAGADSRSSRSTSGTISSTFWPAASRIDRFASAVTGITVFCSCGDPPSTPFTSSDGSAHVRT